MLRGSDGRQVPAMKQVGGRATARIVRGSDYSDAYGPSPLPGRTAPSRSVGAEHRGDGYRVL